MKKENTAAEKWLYENDRDSWNSEIRREGFLLLYNRLMDIKRKSLDEAEARRADFIIHTTTDEELKSLPAMYSDSGISLLAKVFCNTTLDTMKIVSVWNRHFIFPKEDAERLDSSHLACLKELSENWPSDTGSLMFVKIDEEGRIVQIK